MRNLKRALSLALASVMLMGMMVVGTSAASFPDVDDNDNIEAIDVLETVEVMIGNENGDFEPDKPVTRAEMAVVMAKLLNLDYNYYVTTCPFNDVPEWARGYVGACAANGIVSGRGEGVYDPNATVTAVEAASMMMRALGYFQNSGDYSPNFESATVRQASAISLFSGIDGNANTPLSRNQVAKLALNALEANMVYFTGDMGFEMPGVGIVGYRSEYTARTGSEAKYRAISSLGTTVGGDNSQSYVQLGEQLYDGDLKKNTNVTDGFQAPATRWTYKNTEIGTYTDDENYMLEGEVKSSAMYSTVGKAVAEDYTWSIYMDGEAKDVFTKADVKANNGDALKGTGRGTVTYVYLDSNRRTAVVTVVNTYVAEVTKVKDGKITLNDAAKQLEVEAAGYEEDDIVLYTKYKDGSSWKVGKVIGAAELVEGEADTVRNDKYVVIGDTTYNYSTKFNENGEPKVSVESVGKDVALYLDGQGNIIYVGEANESTDYALVLDVGVATNKYGEDAEYGAQLLLTDGKTLNVDLDKDYTDGVLARSGDGVDKVRSELKGKAVAYTKESNGTYTLDESKGDMTTVTTATTDAVKNGRSSIDLGADKNPRYAYTNESTIFVIHERGEKNTDVNVYTGYKSVPDVKTLVDGGAGKPASVISVYKDSKNVVKAVFITNAEISGTKDIIFVVGDKDVKLEGKGDNRYYTFKAIVDGEATTIDIKETAVTADAGCISVKALEKDAVAVFAGMSVNGDGLVTRLKTVSGDIVKADYTGVQALNSGVYGFNWNGTSKVYDIKIAPTDKTVIAYLDDGTLTVENNLETDNNDKAIVVTDKGELSAIFVTKVDEEGPKTELPELFVEETDEGFMIHTAASKMTAAQICQAIADKLGVSVDEVEYDGSGSTKTAKVGKITYKVELNLSATKEEVGGVETAEKLTDSINKNEDSKVTATQDGNTITLTKKGSGEYTAEDLKADIKAILVSLNAQGTTEIVYEGTTYKWDAAAKDFLEVAALGRTVGDKLSEVLAEAGDDVTVETNDRGTVTIVPPAGVTSPAVKAVYDSGTVTKATLGAATNKISVGGQDITVAASDTLDTFVSKLGQVSALTDAWTITKDGTDGVKFVAKVAGEKTLAGATETVKGKNAVAAEYKSGTVTAVTDNTANNMTIGGWSTQIDGTTTTELSDQLDAFVTAYNSDSGNSLWTASKGTDAKTIVFTAKTAGAFGSSGAPTAAPTDTTKVIEGADAVAAEYKLTGVAAKIEAATSSSATLTIGGFNATVTTDTLAEQLDEFIEQYTADSNNEYVVTLNDAKDGIKFTAKVAGAVGGDGPTSAPTGATVVTPGVDAEVSE